MITLSNFSNFGLTFQQFLDHKCNQQTNIMDKSIEHLAHLIIAAGNDFLAIRIFYAIAEQWFGINGTPALENKVDELRKQA